MLILPQTAEYALRAVCYIAEHDAAGPVSGPAIAAALGAPTNYLSKLLHQLGRQGVLGSVRGVQGGYRLGLPADQLLLATIVKPFVAEVEHRCIMGRPQCREDQPCGAHERWKDVNDTAAAFFAELTIADLLTVNTPTPEGR